MYVERSLSRRLLRPLLMILLVITALVLPTWLWLVRGRKLPLEVVLDPPAYLVQASGVVPLRPRIVPAGPDLKLTWEGPGIFKQNGAFFWRAPAQSGLYTVGLTVKRSANQVSDSVTFQVIPSSPDTLPVALPPQPSFPPDLPPCTGTAPFEVVIHAPPYCDEIIVAEARGAPLSPIWHWCGDRGETAEPGRFANLMLEPGAGKQAVHTLLVDEKRFCAWRVTTRVPPDRCPVAPSSQKLRTAFSWQMVGPAHFRFAAQPSRSPGIRHERYLWDFGDGARKTTTKPLVAHRFRGPRRRWHLVKLRTESRQGHAESVRAVMDRSVAP